MKTPTIIALLRNRTLPMNGTKPDPLCRQAADELERLTQPTGRRWARTGTALQVVGVIGMASKLIEPEICFAIMYPGACIWFGVAIVRRDTEQALLQFVFAGANIVGLLRWAA